MTRSLIIVILAAGLSLGGIGGVLARWHWDGGDAGAPDAEAIVGIGHPIYEIDPRDDRALAAYATDIFIGRVLGQTGAAGAPTSAPGQEMPQSQFAVDVLHAVKGRAGGVVTINQVGGLDRQAGQIMLLEGDALLRAGESELFLAVSVPEREWYQIVAAGHGHLPVHDGARRAALIDRFTQATAPLGERDESFAARDWIGLSPPEQTDALSTTRAQLADEPIDFIRFNGAVYLSTVYLEDNPSAPFSPISPQDVGPVVGRVVTNWIDGNDGVAYPNEPCYWDTADGGAPRLSPGDAIYAVRGYATTFRLAARHDSGFVSYQVWCNDEAEVGADLFDIFDRVERIAVTGDLSESSGFAIIEDRATVASLVGMLLAGEVIPEERVSTVPVTHQMIVHLDDGSTFRASAAPGEFLWGLGAVAVPAAFTEALDRAWASQVGAAGFESS